MIDLITNFISLLDNIPLFVICLLCLALYALTYIILRLIRGQF